MLGVVVCSQISLKPAAVVGAPGALGWEHESGSLGYMDAAMTPNLYVEGEYYPADERVEITGTRGVIYVTGCTGRPTEAPPLIVLGDGRATAHTDLRYDWLDSFTDSGRDFIDAVQNGRPPHLTGERGRDVMAFALGAREAAATGTGHGPVRAVGQSAATATTGPLRAMPVAPTNSPMPATTRPLPAPGRRARTGSSGRRPRPRTAV